MASGQMTYVCLVAFFTKHSDLLIHKFDHSYSERPGKEEVLTTVYLYQCHTTQCLPQS